MGGKPRKDRAVALIDQFLQHRKMEQTQDYLSRGQTLCRAGPRAIE